MRHTTRRSFTALCAAFWFAGLTACGSASPRAATIPGPTPVVPEWSALACPSTRPVAVFEIDGAHYVVGPRDRFIIEAPGIRHARQIPHDTFVSAHRLSDRNDAPWFFVTDGGAVMQADDFLGPLALVATFPGEVDADRQVAAGGAIVVRAPLSSERWLFDPVGGVRALTVPNGSVVIAAAVRLPDLIALLLEPGEVVVSRDGGTTYGTLETGGRIIVDAAVRDGRVVLTAADGARVSIEAGDALSELAHDDALGDEETDYDDYDDYDDDYEEGEDDEDPVTAALSAGADAWCTTSTIPLDVVAAWTAGGPPPSSTEDLRVPDRCSARVSRAVVVAECMGEHPGDEIELQLLDPSTGELRSVGTLAGATSPSGDTPVASSGSHTFAFPYATDDDRYGRLRWTFYDGTHLVALDPDALGGSIVSVHDDRAFVRTEDGESRALELVRMPSLEAIDLALPEGVNARAGTFAFDGTLIVTTGIGDTRVVYVGMPGDWMRASVPDDIDDFAMADARRGMLSTSDALYTTSDGGRTWDRLPIAPRSRAPVQCTAAGCVASGVATFRLQASTEDSVVIDTPRAPPAEPPSLWYYDSLPPWRCEPPASTTWNFEPGEVRVATVAEGVGTIGASGTRGRPVAWWSADATGGFHGSATLPDLHWSGFVVLTRGFAVVHGDDVFEVASRRPHALNELAGQDTRHPHALPLSDGGALVAVDLGGQARGTASVVVRLDRTGDVVASHTYVWTRDTIAARGLAEGPNGVVGPAVSSRTVPYGWTVFPIDGSAPIDLDVPLASSAPCTETQPWSLQFGGLAPVELYVGRELRTTSGRVVAGVGPDGACVQVVESGGLTDPSAVPVAFASHGQIRGFAVDASARGVPLTCTVDAP
jgi:hypothetical protein